VSRIPVVDVSAERLERLRAIHHQLDLLAPVRYIHNHDPTANDRLVGELPPHSLVINATGLGKDLPGSPLSDAAVFPESGYAWDVNYRGNLRFLQQARAQQDSRHVRVEDGWRYFIHGWAAVMSRVFDVYIGPDETARLAAIAEPERPRTTIRQ
jgi:shikimate dehydrogenase